MAVETYEQVPYQSNPYPFATAERMAVIAHLFGMTPADPRTARVLEIGCAGAGNIIPRALACPDAEFVGIDPASQHVEQASQLIAALGLDNIRVDKRRVEELTEADGTFDYIVIHGVYSWVPVESRKALLDACRRHLRPQGVAYVSYNTLPGWHMRGIVRDAMLFHTERFDDPLKKVEQARAMLQFLSESAPQHKGVWQQFLADETARLSRGPDDYVFHEQLSPDNDPMYFHQFVDRARESGLDYLGEALFDNMVTANLTKEVRDKVELLAPDIVRAQQYIDFVTNRAFRHSLLVHHGVKLRRKISWERVRGMSLGSSLRSAEPVDLTPGVPAHFEVPGTNQQLESGVPSIKAGWRILMERRSGLMPFSDWVAAINAELESVGLAGSALSEEALGNDVLFGYSHGICEIGMYPLVLDGHRSPFPRAFPIARLQANTWSTFATSLRHEGNHLDAVSRMLLRTCDGTRTVAQLEALVRQALDAGELVSTDDDDGDEVDLSVAVPEQLESLGRAGLLVPVTPWA